MSQRTLTIRGIPDEVLARLRARAAGQHRSLNGEVLALLARASQEDAPAASGAAVREAAATYAATADATVAPSDRALSTPEPGGPGRDPAAAAPHVTDTPPAAAPHVAYSQPPPASLLDTVDHDALARVCRQQHIRWLAVFGSHARGDARRDSDVDVVVEFEPGMTPGLGIIRVANALRPVLGGRRVDLVTRRGLAPRLRDRILSEARELYAAR